MIRAEGKRVEVSGDLIELMCDISAVLGGLYNGIKIKEGEQTADSFKCCITSETFWNISVSDTSASNTSGNEIRHLAIDKTSLTDEEVDDIGRRFFEKCK